MTSGTYAATRMAPSARVAWSRAMLVGLLTAAAATPATAQDASPTPAERAEEARTLMVIRPANIASALRSIGLEAKILQQGETNHILQAGSINIYLEGCTKAHCKSIRMETGMPRAPTTLEKINQINRAYSGARVSLSLRPDEPGMIIVDVTYNSMAGVVSFENLRSLKEYLQLAIPVVDQYLASP
jgi:hypothetical protein